MKEYEIHFAASYTTEGGSKESDAYTELVNANTPAEARKILRAQLRAEGYYNITISDTLATE